ncbi:MAG TPA: hypothetical protein VEI97_10170 [bacterium]|nr:hypothetical protein [bacterium]
MAQMLAGIIGVLGLLSAVGVLVSGCGPEPTRAIVAEQRKTPFFKVLVYEGLPLHPGGIVQVILFEDVGGGCYLTSGTDGGVIAAPLESCRRAKELPSVERAK